MKKIEIKLELKQLNIDELDNEKRMLVEKAIEATSKSYANYSKFNVGAALLLENGEIILGANQENAAFPVSLCAERTAIFAAQTQYPDQPIKMIAIAARTPNGLTEDPITPCGSCRQVMLGIEERYGKPIKILLYGTRCVYEIDKASDLIPLSFVDSSMR